MADENSDKFKQKPGILRLDISKPRRSSGGSVEFRNHVELLGEEENESNSPPATTATSPQLSVRWAFPEFLIDELDNFTDAELNQMQQYLQQSDSEIVNERNLSAIPINDSKKGRKTQSTKDQEKTQIIEYMETINPSLDIPEYINSEDDDYSISVSAVMQRRASTRGHRKKGGYISPRRTSSQMSHVVGVGGSGVVGASVERRRSSVFTTSSGETGISIGDGTHQDSTKDQIFENIRLHKEVLQSVKLQPWSMRRKLRLVRQAKEYIARHEGALQERFAMSRSTKDLWARFKIQMASRWTHWKRELANISTIIIPWELRIKEIESHFGSVVASYFTFLRWLLWVNIVIAVALTIFVVMPEFIASKWHPKKEDHRKNMLPDEKHNATRLMAIWDFEGYLKYSPIFYGYYSDFSGAVKWHYDLPLAYFLTGLLVYIYSFWATLRKMAENSRMSKLSSKDDECVFSWKLFTGWDFMIGHTETAHNRIASVVLGFKEALLEEAEKKKDKRNWKVIVLRVIVNILVLNLLSVSAYAVVFVVDRSTQNDANGSYWRKNEITIVITGISFFFPMFFEGLGFLESYHPRKQLRMQLGRIMALNLLNLYALIFALFDKIDSMSNVLVFLKKNITLSRDLMSLGGVVPTNFSFLQLTNATNLTEKFDLHNIQATNFLQNTTTFLNDLIRTTAVMPHFTDVTTLLPENITKCFQIVVNCSIPNLFNRTLMANLFLMNFTTTMLPNLWQNQTMNLTYADSDLLNSTQSYNDTIFDDYDSANSTFDFEYFDRNSTDNITTRNFVKRQIHFDEFSTSDTENHDINFYDKMSELYANLQQEENNFSTTTTTENLLIDEDQQNSNLTDIYVTTITTFLDNITSTSWNGENITDYENFVTEKFLEYIEYTEQTTEFNQPPEECYETICELVEDDYVSTLDPGQQNDQTSTISPYDYEKPMIPINDINFDFNENDGAELTTIWTTETTTYPYDENSTAIIDGAHENKTYVKESLTKYISHMNPLEQLELRKLCWETMFGQELVKLTVMDLVATVTSTIFMDFFRALFVRFFNKCWCWDLEKRYPKYGDFKIAENILHLVNNQGQVWMGMFFSPGLAILNLIKLVIILYLRSWTVLTCNVPHEVVFRASRSNNFYLALLLTMLFLCVLPVGYAIVWLKPSWHCGPFSNYKKIYHIFTKTLERILPKEFHRPIDIIASCSTVIPLLLLLVLIIYYLLSLTGALREANQDLRIQLRRERTEGRKKMLKLPTTKSEDANNGGNAMDRWRKVLEASSPLTPTGTVGGGTLPDQDEGKIQARKELLARIMKKALRKSSNTSEDLSIPAVHADVGDDETDTEQHESLPHDREIWPSIKKKSKTKNPFQNVIEEKKSIAPPSMMARKSSISRLKDVVQLAAKKDLVNEHPIGRFKVANVHEASTPTTAKNVDPQHEDKSKQMPTRRRSLLRRQSNLSNDCTSGPLKVPRESQDREDVNYKIVNEKNQQMEQKSKLKPKLAEPEVFRFDADDLFKNDDDISDDDNTSYKEIDFPIRLPKLGSSSQDSSGKSKTQSSNDTFWNQNTSEDTFRDANHDQLQKIKPNNVEPLTKSVSSQVKFPDEKPKKRFNSFFALVQKAMYAKKQESLSESVDTVPNESISDEIIKRRDSRRSSRRKIRPKPKRQDSSSSIWSDNIPVITISKTESDECILETNSKPPSPKQQVTDIESGEQTD